MTLSSDEKYYMKFNSVSITYKSKTIPLQAWTDPEVFRRLRLPDFKTICT